MKALDLVEKHYLKKDIPTFKVGDMVKIFQKVIEGDKTRTQVFEGRVIRRRGKGTSETFTVLKESKGSTDIIEKTFSLHSPAVEKIKVLKHTQVRRSKLYYLRNKK